MKDKSVNKQLRITYVIIRVTYNLTVSITRSHINVRYIYKTLCIWIIGGESGYPHSLVTKYH